jgi:histidyl-tRNA synthetase
LQVIKVISEVCEVAFDRGVAQRDIVIRINHASVVAAILHAHHVETKDWMAVARAIESCQRAGANGAVARDELKNLNCLDESDIDSLVRCFVEREEKPALEFARLSHAYVQRGGRVVVYAPTDFSPLRRVKEELTRSRKYMNSLVEVSRQFGVSNLAIDETLLYRFPYYDGVLIQVTWLEACELSSGWLTSRRGMNR